MNKYHNGKIYKITDIGYNKCYIGSTCESLSQRMARHRSQYKYYLTNKKHPNRSFYLFDEYGIDNCKIELVEKYHCESKEELRQRAGFYIENTNCVNRCVAGRTPKEYKDLYNPLNQDKIKEGYKQWYENNKEHWKGKVKEYREANKEKLKEKTKETVECVCGAVVTKYKLKRHQETKKHIDFMNTD